MGISDISNTIRDLQQGNAMQFGIYGDSIYPFDSHLSSIFSGNDLTEQNRAMLSVRECIEWGYADLSVKFAC